MHTTNNRVRTYITRLQTMFGIQRHFDGAQTMYDRRVGFYTSFDRTLLLHRYVSCGGRHHRDRGRFCT